MMRALYFDCYAGASGDMILGALIDLGVDVDTLRQQLSSLALGGYEIKARSVKRGGIAAINLDVAVSDQKHPARTLYNIYDIINRSSLSDRVKSRSIQVFKRLAKAEARVHATTPDKVHFHEVGAVDSLIDVVGAMIGFEMLGIDRFFSSPLRTGRGSVKAEHGLLPVPAPGTAELLRGVPVYSGELDGEFVTPTGAAIVTALCESFGPLPPMRILRIGYGAGDRDPEGFPNALRLLMGDLAEGRPLQEGQGIAGFEDSSARSRAQGEAQKRAESRRSAQAPSPPEQSVVVIECNIDDMNPQVYGFVMERAFSMGALDVFMTPVQMKKGRPGVLLTVLCEEGGLDSMIDLLLAETTTLGVRYYEARRRVLERSLEAVDTRYGRVRIKVAREGARTLHFQPEYDDCERLAKQSRVTLIEVQGAASAAYRAALKSTEKSSEKSIEPDEEHEREKRRE